MKRKQTKYEKYDDRKGKTSITGKFMKMSTTPIEKKKIFLNREVPKNVHWINVEPVIF